MPHSLLDEFVVGFECVLYSRMLGSHNHAVVFMCEWRFCWEKKEKENRNKSPKNSSVPKVSIKNSAKESYEVLRNVRWHGHNTKLWISHSLAGGDLPGCVLPYLVICISLFVQNVWNKYLIGRFILPKYCYILPAKVMDENLQW